MRCSSLLVILLFAGCTMHNRVTAGPTLATDSKTPGAEVAAESTLGPNDGPIRGVARIAGHIGEGRNGASLLVGGELESLTAPWGGRVTAGIGPAFTSDGEGIAPHVLVHGALALVHPFDFHDIGDETTSKTVGLELFVNNIGLDASGTVVGFGVTLGRRTVQRLPSKSIMSGGLRRPTVAIGP